MTNSFYVVTIGIKHEGAVIVFMIFWSQTRPAIILAPSSKSRFVKFVDRFATVCSECNMKSRFIARTFTNIKISFS